MIITSTGAIQLTRSTAAAIKGAAFFIDANASTGANAGIPAPQTFSFSSAATTDIVSAPSSGNARHVTRFFVRNDDASLSCDATVILDIGGTDTPIHKVTLTPGDCLEYIEHLGFMTLTTAARFNETRYVTADSVHATAATFAGITGLSFSVKSGRNYAFLACLNHVENAATTGAQFALGGVAMSDISITSFQAQTAAASTTSAIIQTGVATAVDTAVIVATAGQTTVLPTIISGGFSPSADGTLQVKATSEVTVASGLTVKKRSWAQVIETVN